MITILRRSLLGCALFAFVATLSPAPVFSAGGTQIVGRVLDAGGGLPVGGATVSLEHGTTVVGTTQTDANGQFTFNDEPPGVYVALVRADGYQPTETADIFITAGEAQATVSLAVTRQSGGMRTISNVRVAARGSLQTTATYNQNIDASQIQAVGYLRAGDALWTLPFVNGSTSSSLGDDLSLSIRGYDSTETATLLDGHPIGPIGAHGQGFDYQVSPFWGLSNMQVVYGSGATGLYAVPTVAGAINFETLAPSRTPEFTAQQGFGTFGKEFSGVSATGYAGKLGYAIAYGVQGTSGELVGHPTQWGMLANPNSNGCDSATNAPSIAAADVAACSYYVNGDYILRNGVAKLSYDLTRTTNIQATMYDLTDWANSPGNGDTDFLTFPASQYLVANSPPASTITLPNGNKVSCSGSTYPVVSDAPSGFTCFTAAQYAATFYGPFGGGPGRYHDARNQDYHARITQQLGPTQLVLDGYADSYGFDNIKGFQPTANHFEDLYYTHGFLASDEYAHGRNDMTAGLFIEHQQHIGSNQGNGTIYPNLQLSFTNYFLRDTYTPNSQISVFGDLALQRDQNTATTYVNPRLSFMYRPTPDDVIRLTGGRSASVPDPSNLYGGISFGSVQSYNPSCGSNLNSIATGNNPKLQPEDAVDYELAYGHRFTARTLVQADAYESSELNPLVSGTFPLSTLPSNVIPDLSGFLAKLQSLCGSTFTASHFGVTDLFNAGSAKYKGLTVQSSIALGRALTLDAGWALQSAAYYGMSNDILVNNVHLINGSQIDSVPLHRANFGIGYSDDQGWSGRLDGYYIGYPNGLNRLGYTYFNFNVAKELTKQLTLNLGVLNVFNSNVQQYGLIGLGPYVPENQFGSDTSAFQQGSAAEQFGLAPAQFFFSISKKI